MEAARQCSNDRKEWRAPVCNKEFYAAIFAWPCVLSNLPPVFWWLSPHLERGGMPLHDAVGLHCKKDATT